MKIFLSPYILCFDLLELPMDDGYIATKFARIDLVIIYQKTINMYIHYSKRKRKVEYFLRLFQIRTKSLTTVNFNFFNAHYFHLEMYEIQIHDHVILQTSKEKFSISFDCFRFGQRALQLSTSIFLMRIIFTQRCMKFRFMIMSFFKHQTELKSLHIQDNNLHSNRPPRCYEIIYLQIQDEIFILTNIQMLVFSQRMLMSSFYMAFLRHAYNYGKLKFCL